MIVLTGKNSLIELISLSKDRLSFFDKVAKEFDLEYMIWLNASNDKEIKATIDFSGNRYGCQYYITQKDFYLHSNGFNDYSKRVNKMIRDESNKKELNEVLEYLKHKISIISDYLKFEKKLKIEELTVFFNRDSSKNIMFYLESSVYSPYNMYIGNDLFTYDCCFKDCNSKDIEHIMNNYKIKQNTKITLKNFYDSNARVFSVNKNIDEVKDEILKFINNEYKGVNDDNFNR